MRLQKFLRDQGLGSLRYCDDLVQGGKVIINETPLKDPTYYLKKGDRVKTIQKKLIQKEFIYEPIEKKYQYYLFYKPTKVVSTHQDPQRRRIVFDYFKKEISNELPLYYAGRLDYLSRGLMIISSDGNFIHSMTHPSKNQTKEYEVTTKYDINYQYLDSLSGGFTFGDIDYLPFKYKPVKDNKVIIELKEGKNHQVRNIISTIDNEVLDLFRTRMGKYTIGHLKTGQFKAFTPYP